MFILKLLPEQSQTTCIHLSYPPVRQTISSVYQKAPRKNSGIPATTFLTVTVSYTNDSDLSKVLKHALHTVASRSL